MTARPRVALIGTGGTIAAMGRHACDLIDYDANGLMLDSAELLERFGDLLLDVHILPVQFPVMSSAQIYFPEWRSLVLLCDTVVAENADVCGIVILHGTATLEETAYFLNLTLKVDVPVVVAGAQRPANGISSDGAINLRNAVCVASDPAARGLGVLVVMNDEIHAARDVTKAATYRLNAFQSPDFGPLGYADGDAVTFYRRPFRCSAPYTDFDIRQSEDLPRVDVAYAYAGADEVLIRAAVDAGARGIVAAGFAPGAQPPRAEAALREAVRLGVVVVQSTRAGSGRVGVTSAMTSDGILSSDNLPPQKARILLALALTRTNEHDRVAELFLKY